MTQRNPENAFLGIPDLGRDIVEIELFLDFFVPKFDFWEASKPGKSPNPVSGHFRDEFGNRTGKNAESRKEGRSMRKKGFKGRCEKRKVKSHQHKKKECLAKTRHPETMISK